jgi:hypothetical protein
MRQPYSSTVHQDLGGKAQQTVRVERVTVHEGGQAIVGDVTHGGRVDDKK